MKLAEKAGVYCIWPDLWRGSLRSGQLTEGMGHCHTCLEVLNILQLILAGLKREQVLLHLTAALTFLSMVWEIGGGGRICCPGQRSEAVISMVLVVGAGAGFAFAWPEVSCIQFRGQRFAAPGKRSHTVCRGGR